MHLDRTAFRVPRRPSFLVAAVAVLALAAVAAFVLVAGLTDAPADGRAWPGTGFVVLAAVGVVALASLLDALRRRPR